MQHTTSQILYKYWNEIRARRMAPRRFEIEPARFATILPETFVLECEEGEGHRFRLAGTRVNEKLGFDLRGHEFSDLFDGSEHAALKPFFNAITHQGAVGVLTADMPAASGRSARFEALILPLIHTEDRITRLLGALSARTCDPWLGHEPLRPGRIAASKVIWPDGHPHTPAAPLAPPSSSPFKFDFTRSRLVRSRRRQFRVYEGGR